MAKTSDHIHSFQNHKFRYVPMQHIDRASGLLIVRSIDAKLLIRTNLPRSKPHLNGHCEIQSFLAVL